jgi:hypothetical protein
MLWAGVNIGLTNVSTTAANACRPADPFRDCIDHLQPVCLERKSPAHEDLSEQLFFATEFVGHRCQSGTCSRRDIA